MDLPTGPAGQPDLVLEFYVAFDRTCPFTKSSTYVYTRCAPHFPQEG